MIKRNFLLTVILLIISTAVGCKPVNIPVFNESSFEESDINVTAIPTVKPTDELIITEEPTVDTIDISIFDDKFSSSKADISLNLDFNIYAYSEGIWGDGAYDCLSIYFNNFDVDYYEVELNDKIYTVIEEQLFLNENYINTLIDEFSIRAYDWNDNLLDQSNFNNIMFFSPVKGSKLDDILHTKNELTHLWVVGSEYNRHDEFSTKVSLAELGEFVYLETLVLDNNVEYADFDANDIGKLNRLHTLNIELFLNNLDFLIKLPYLTNLELWLDENCEYSNIGVINSLKKFDVYSSNIFRLNLLSNFPNLTILKIQSSSLQNLSNLADLVVLEELVLARTDNLIKESLESAPSKLSKLIVFATERPDYSFLELFNHVEELRIINTDITDLSFLELYDNLTILDLNRSYASLHYEHNIDCIKDQTNLTTLILPIDYYNYCEVCNGGNNMEQEHKLTNVSFMKDLSNLQNLVIDIENIEDISVIMEMETLKELVLANVTDISMFKDNLTTLNSLTLLNTSIADFSLLKHLENLKSIHVYENYFYDSEGNYNWEYEHDFTFLNELTKLKYIKLYNFDMYYKVKDDTFPDLGNLKELILLDFGSLECTDISGIFKATNIETLILEECIFSDLDGIENLNKLNVLDLSWIDINDEAVDALRLIFGDELIILEWG